MDYGLAWVLIGSLMLLASIFAGLLSSRVGAPLLLVFLGLGMLAGREGPGGIVFQDSQLAFILGSTALAVILFDGGLRTPRATIERGLGPALALSTVGVLITAGLVAAVAHYLLGFGWVFALLLGSIVSATDAAAVFLLLGRSGIALRDRLRSTLEVESGSNDPMAVFLTITFTTMLAAGELELGWWVVGDFALQMGLGGTLGAAGGFALVWLMNRLELSGGLYPILALAGALLIFSGTQLAGGSGFLAIYVAGIVFGNRRVRADQLVGRFFDGLSWLSQIVLFLLLGLLVTPSELLPDLGTALVLAVTLMLVARPLATLICLTPFRFPLREQAFAAWVGLRGAVPIFLALFPFLEGFDRSGQAFNIAFVVVLVSLLLQGWTIPWVAHRLHVSLPPEPEAATRLDLDLARRTDRMDRDLIAYEVMPHSRAADFPLAALDLPKRTRLIVVIRDGIVQRLPEVQQLTAGDFVLVVTPPETAATLDRFFSRRFASTAGQLSVDQGDFLVDGSSRLGDLCAAYGVELGKTDPSLSLAELLRSRLGEGMGRGDRLRFGQVEFIVVDKIGPEPKRVGIVLEPDPEDVGWRRKAASRVRGRLRALRQRLPRIGLGAGSG
ncbi:potassium/proton antiporter [Algihabitans albus]|uniref:potassium/proton antiporter n=1 Tax=Algihabitans albus TaxID=2164067 RepID=UPI001ABCD9FC|nr:potassium/proton antiporter [Algihabitans albus]